MSCDHDGCWVHIFEDEDFSETDANTIIYGPVELRNMKNVNGKDWGDQIDSIIVGPNAYVEAWEDENYEDTKIDFGPNTKQKSLNELNFGDEIDSMIVKCTKCGQTTK